MTDPMMGVPLNERIAIPAADALHKELIRNFVFRSCINCELLDRGAKGRPAVATCTLYNATPPPETIVYGCPSWELDIPF